MHAHWVAVDPARDSIVVTGEHTGNVGIVDQGTRQLEQVVGISTPFLVGCDIPPPIIIPPDKNGNGNQPEPPEAPEPHVHGVQINAQTGTAYVTDEGEEECFFESVTILQP